MGVVMEATPSAARAATALISSRFSPPPPSVTFCYCAPFSISKTAPFSGVSVLKRTSSHSHIARAVERSDTGNSGGNESSEALSLANTTNFTRTLFNFSASNFLPLALISAVALGMVNPTLGCHAQKYSLSKFSTCGIFFISGLKLQGKEIEEVAEAWPVLLFGLASILLLSPLLSILILQVRLVPQEFVTGLAIFCCMPTTLSSGVALTQLAGGNPALALAMTVASNLLGVLTVPFWISILLADGFGVSIPTAKLFWSLISTLLVPLILGKVVRNSSEGLAMYIDKNSRILSLASTILLSLTPWMQVSRSRDLLLMVPSQVFIGALGMGLLIHLALLGFNTIALQALSVGCGGRDSVLTNKKNARTLIIICSQKALLIVVAVVEQLNGALGQPGLLVLPCVAAHINQEWTMFEPRATRLCN
ncbi:probable sodium/metabolite cotransporter BASS4, chloroplastic isoform X2 [Euphorbia lathyris]|uniref:probable sodium/metabolite cotransporter BASS4, chloroplastic isoform X2 n=1 Tax=Euphorbia lathyris TaxID=212925 RepID=UPI0033132AE8